MTRQTEVYRSVHPLWQAEIAPADSVRELVCDRCDIQLARSLNATWHSRLPRTQHGPWQYAFAAHKEGIVYAVALWHMRQLARRCDGNTPYDPAADDPKS